MYAALVTSILYLHWDRDPCIIKTGQTFFGNRYLSFPFFFRLTMTFQCLLPLLLLSLTIYAIVKSAMT